MPKQVTEYRCLLISPGDVTPERDAITELGNQWNAQIGKGLGARIEFVRWETHSTPDMSGPPQSVINRQIVDDCDLGIAIFWGRLGTATENYPSGSIEEIERLLDKQSHVSVYFCERALPTKGLDIDQLSRLKTVRENLQKRGLLSTYSEIWDLKEKVNLHLTGIVSQMLSRDRNIPTTGLLTAPTPDVRVTVQPAWSQLHNTFTGDAHPHRVFLGVSAKNYSTIPVFIKDLLIAMKEEGKFAIVTGDYVTSSFPTKAQRTIQPGDNFMFTIDPNSVKEASEAGFKYIAVRDEIGREYRADELETKQAIDILLNDYCKKLGGLEEG